MLLMILAIVRYGKITAAAAVLLTAAAVINYGSIVNYGTSTTTVPSTLYVTITGNDSTGTGTQVAPWATMDKARSVIRAQGYAAQLTTDLVVCIGAGTYYDTAVTIAAADSGRNSGARIVYRACDGNGTAELVGGHTIGGWTLDTGSTYKTALASPVYTIWENGTRADMARSPDRAPGTHYPVAFAPYLSSKGVDNSFIVLQYDPLDFDPTLWTLSSVRFFLWDNFNGPTAWFTDTQGASAVDTTSKQFTISNGGFKFYARAGATDTRYLVTGVKQLITQDGEFAWEGGQLYYRPRATPIGSQTIVVPSTMDIISILGTDANTRVHDVVLDGLAVKYSEFGSTYQLGWCRGIAGCTNSNPASHTDQDYDYLAERPAYQHAGVLIRYADHLTITNTTVGPTGLHGIFADDYIQNVSLTNVRVHHNGGDGVVFNGRYPFEGDVNKNNTVDNILVDHMSELTAGSGIRFANASNSTVSHCEIHSGPRRAFWIFGDYNITPPNNYATGLNVDHCLIHDMMEDSGDGGAYGVSFTGTSSNPSTNVNTLSHTFINGVYAHGTMADTAPAGIMYDDQAGGQAVNNTMIVNVQGLQRRLNGDTPGTETNVNYTGVFTQSALDWANIGITANHPYRTAGGYTFTESFEGAFGEWSSAGGTPTTSTTQAHDGTHSFSQTASGQVIYRFQPWRTNGKLSVWFYDDATDTTCDSMVRYDDKLSNFQTPASAPGWRTVGVSTSESTTKYVVWAYPSPGTVVTSVNRTTGWHRFQFDYSNSNSVPISIDGSVVVTAAAGTTDGHMAAQLAIGDFWVAGRTCAVYWDQVEITP